jgi:hypothetical protein
MAIESGDHIGDNQEHGSDRYAEIMDGNVWIETGYPFVIVPEVLSNGALHQEPKQEKVGREIQLRLFL